MIIRKPGEEGIQDIYKDIFLKLFDALDPGYLIENA
jgi:hypothetical protein